MAQIRYHNFARSLVSFDENLRVLGLAQSGRICGFDVMAVQGGNTLRLSHTLSGFIATDASGAAMAQRGVIQTKQGVIIHEDAPVDVNVDFNVGNGSERIDTLILSHSNIQSPGGAVATYSVIKGPVSTPFPYRGPAVSNPLTQVPIGIFIVPAGAVDHTLTTYEPLSVKGLGGSGIFDKASELNLRDVSSGYQKGDFNRLNKSGIHYFTSTLNRPSSASSVWFVIVMAQGANITQVAVAGNSGKVYGRSSANTGTSWTSWVSLNNPDIDTSIAALAASIGNLNYPFNNYVTDGEDLTDSIGILDAALNTVDDALVIANININNLSIAIGNLNYSSNVYVTDGQSLTAAIGVLDAALSAGLSSLSSSKADKSLIFTAGNGLSGGGDHTANRTFDVNVDGSTIEINSDALRVKALGIATGHIQDSAVTTGKIADGNVTDVKLASKFLKAGDGVQLLTKYLTQSWNMDTLSGINLTHGLTESKIVGYVATVFSNGNTQHVSLASWVGNTNPTDKPGIAFGEGGGGVMSLRRADSSPFDSAGWNAATVKVMIVYEP